MKIGLALSGGGIRGIAHAGAIKALEENNINIEYIGGTSSGSMIASLYAMGYKPEEILELFKKYAETIVKIDSKKITNEIKNFVFRKKIQSMGINTGEFIEEIYNKIAKKKNIEKLSDIKMPIAIPVVNISKSEKYVFISKKSNEDEKYISDITVGRAVRASSSFPIVYMPVEYKGDMLSDGGILDNIPADEVKKLGAEKVISIKFDSDKIEKTSNAMELIMKIVDIMGNKISEESLAKSDYILTIPSDGTGLLDVSKIDFCYNSGYETTKKKIDKIKENVFQNIQTYKNIKI